MHLLFLWKELIPLKSDRMPEHCDLWGGTPLPPFPQGFGWGLEADGDGQPRE